MSNQKKTPGQFTPAEREALIEQIRNSVERDAEAFLQEYLDEHGEDAYLKELPFYNVYREAKKEVDPERLNELLQRGRELFRTERSTDEESAEADSNQLTINGATYQLSLSDRFLGLLKVEGLIVHRLAHQWRQSQRQPGQHIVRVEWAGQSIQIPLERFLDRRKFSSVPLLLAARTPTVETDKEATMKKVELPPERPKSLFEAEVDETWGVRFLGDSSTGDIYLHLLRTK